MSFIRTRLVVTYHLWSYKGYTDRKMYSLAIDYH